MIPFIEMVDARSAADGGPRMTYFEVLVAVAYAAFADAPVDVAVVEVGMGGSWDATNVVDAQVAVVTPIAIDHERFLGLVTGGHRHGEERHHQGRTRSWSAACRSRRSPRSSSGAPRRSARHRLFEGNEFGILRREVAVGGQQLAHTRPWR